MEASHPPASHVNYLKPILTFRPLSLQTPGEAITEKNVTLPYFQSGAERSVSWLFLMISHVLMENPFTVEFSLLR